MTRLRTVAILLALAVGIAALVVALTRPDPAHGATPPGQTLEASLRYQLARERRVVQHDRIVIRQLRRQVRGGEAWTHSTNRAIGRALAQALYGWGPAQFSALDRLVTRESTWNERADNPTSDAYGIPQALPGSKMARYGPEWRTNPVPQILWLLAYVRGRYGSPQGALQHSFAHGWY